MQILRDAADMEHAASTWPPDLARLVAHRLEFLRQDDGFDVSELANLILVEPGDTLNELDAALNGQALSDPWGGRDHGDPGFVPCFETCEDHGGFVAVVFIVGDAGFAYEVLIPRSADIDPLILGMFAPHATPAAVSP